MLRLTALALALLALGCASTEKAQRQATLSYRDGLVAFEKRDFANARTHFEASLKSYWTPLAQVALARSLDRMGRFDLACLQWVPLASEDTLADLAKAGDDKARSDVVEMAESCWKKGRGVPLAARGADDPFATIVLAVDYEDILSAELAREVEALRKKHPQHVRVVLLQHPQTELGMLAARAAVAAQLQGKLWPMHDELFPGIEAPSEELVTRIADKLGLDAKRFAADLASPGVRAFLERQRGYVTALDLHGGAALVNGERAAPGALDKAVAEAIAAGRDAVKGGTDRADVHAVLASGKPRYVQLMVDGVDIEPKTFRPTRPRTSTVSKKVWRATVRKQDPILGPRNAPVTIVMFGSYQCPFCKRSLKTLEHVRRVFGNHVRIVNKHKPLPFHKRAVPAAYAALAAHEQGKFWAMHARIFENQRELTDESFARWAEELDLDVGVFTDAVEDGKARFGPHVDADLALADQLEVRGTPAFFINGRSMRGALPFAVFRDVIREELRKARELLDAGIDADRLYGHIIAKGAVKHDLEDKVDFAIEGRGAKGRPDAPITLTVFLDYQCPFCQRFVKTLDDVQRTLGDKTVRIVYKNLPLSFHKQAMNAARAAMAAKRQGKFWEMSRLLLDNARGLADDSYAGFARRLGLNEPRFLQDMQSPETTKLIEQDLADAKAIGVRGTPTTFINGRKIRAPASRPEQIVALIRKHFLDKR